MSLFTKITRYQKAVYWAPSNVSDDFGKPGVTYSDFGQAPVLTPIPIEIGCRWEECIEEVITPKNRVVKSCAKVYTDRVVLVGGVLWLGTLVSIFDQYASPYENSDAWEIIKFASINNLRATKTLRIAWLGTKGTSYG